MTKKKSNIKTYLVMIQLQIAILTFVIAINGYITSSGFNDTRKTIGFYSNNSEPLYLDTLRYQIEIFHELEKISALQELNYKTTIDERNKIKKKELDKSKEKQNNIGIDR